MFKKTIIIFTFLISSFSFGQTYYGEIITKENDTLKTIQIKINPSVFTTARLIALQARVKVIQNNVETEYLPDELKSFKIRMDDKIYTFDSVDNLLFAQRMYVGKVKLYKYFGDTNSLRYYLIKKPNGEKISEMVAMGLSRLITKDTMLPVIADCKVSYEKIENDEIKIKNEDILIEFIKDYEKNCF